MLGRALLADPGDVELRFDSAGAGDGTAPVLPDAALTRSLRLYVRGRLGDHADNDDLIQETYVRLLTYQSRARVGNIAALCFTIVRNLVLDRHRRGVRDADVALDEHLVCPQPTAERVVAYRRAVEILTRTLERMPPLRREIFLRRRLDGIPAAEISTNLDMSLAAVEKHISRALRDLRTALARRGFTMTDGA